MISVIKRDYQFKLDIWKHINILILQDATFGSQNDKRITSYPTRDEQIKF
jgi:hypothetical protein